MKEALAAWQRVLELDPEGAGNRERLAAAYLALNDVEAVRRMAVEMLEKDHRTRDPHRASEVCWIAVLIPDFLTKYGQLPPQMGRFADSKQADADALRAWGAAWYRQAKAGNAERLFNVAARALRRAIEDGKGKDSALDWVFLSMALHHLKEPDARLALVKAKELANDPSLAWYQRVELEHLLKEAEHELKAPVP